MVRIVPVSCWGTRRMSSVTVHSSLADRGHSLRQSTSHNVTFSASGKFQLCLGFSSPHKAGFAGTPSSAATGSAPIAPRTLTCGSSPSSLQKIKQQPRWGCCFIGAGVLLRCPVCALPTAGLRCTPTAATRSPPLTPPPAAIGSLPGLSPTVRVAATA